MKKRKNFRKKKYPKEKVQGLQVKVYNNNIDGALRILKRKIKDSNLMIELRDRQYYRKPSDIKREKIAKAIARERYRTLKEKDE